MNPLMKLQANQSRKPKDRGTQPLTPVLEHVEGVNFPYRGSNEHGVPSRPQSPENASYAGTVDAHYTTHEPMPDPVLVKVVQESTRELRDLIVRREQCSGNPRPILPQNHHRGKARIQNLGTVNLWISPDAGVAVYTGYRIAPNGEIDLTCETPVYAITEDGTPQPVAVLVEYSRRES